KAPIMIILDNPGAREDRDGNPTVCGTRQTLQQAASEVSLKMDDLYVTYILKRKPVRSYEKDQVRQTCMMHLYQQVQSEKPALIPCLGNVALQAFFQALEVDVETFRRTWQEVQGYHTTVAYHSLAFRRRPDLKSLFVDDWS